MKKYNPIAAGAAYTFGNMLIKAIPFITLPVFTRILSTADFGLYNTYLSYENIMTILLGFGLYGTIRIAKVEYKDKFDDYISSIYGVQLVLALITGVIIFAFYTIITNKIDVWLDHKLLIILLCHCFCMQIFSIASAKYAINGEVKSNIILSLIMTFLNVVLSLWLCIFVLPQATYLGRIIGTFAAVFFVAVIAAIQQMKKSRKWIAIVYWKFGLRMGAPLILHSLSLTLLSNCDKIMIQSMIGNSQAGIYSIAVTLTGILSVLVSSADNAWAPWYYQKLENREMTSLKKYDSYMIYAFMAVLMISILVSPELIKCMLAQEYWDAIYVFPALAVSIFFNFMYLIPVNFEYFHKKTSYIAYSTVLTAILNIVLNIVLIRMFGYIGAAYATMLSKLVLLLMHLRKARMLENVELIEKRVILHCSVISLLMIPITLLVVNEWIVRYAILLVVLLGMTIFVKRNTELNILFRKIVLRK